MLSDVPDWRSKKTHLTSFMVPYVDAQLVSSTASQMRLSLHKTALK